jgi:putative flippase GtrA
MFTSNMLGIIFNFKTTGKFVFENDDNCLIFKFVGVNVFIYILSIGGLKLLLLLGVDKYSAAVIIAPVMAVISYLLSKQYVFINKEIK